MVATAIHQERRKRLHERLRPARSGVESGGRGDPILSFSRKEHALRNCNKFGSAGNSTTIVERLLEFDL